MLLPVLMLAAIPAEDLGKCGRAPPADFKWIRPEDYPAEARQRGEQGPVGYRLDVDAEGCVKRCTVTDPSLFAALNTATCAILKRRARFKPARNAAGKRIAAPYDGSYWWVIPEPLAAGWKPPEPRSTAASWVTNDDYPAAALRAEQQGDVGYRLDLDASGRVTACTIWLSSGATVLDATTCSLMRRRARFTPARNAAGEAVPSRWASGIRWRM